MPKSGYFFRDSENKRVSLLLIVLAVITVAVSLALLYGPLPDWDVFAALDEDGTGMMIALMTILGAASFIYLSVIGAMLGMSPDGTARRTAS